MQISIQNKSYTVEVSNKKFSKARVITTEDKVIIFLSDQDNINPKVLLNKWIRDYAKKLIIKRVEDLAAEYNFAYNKISIREQSTRWGSCSSQKNLNFNWKLILAPPYILDYVIIHELAHTIQLNHSAAFWKIVEDIYPNYRECRQWLRKHGETLNID